jgi:hypothetical protein
MLPTDAADERLIDDLFARRPSVRVSVNAKIAAARAEEREACAAFLIAKLDEWHATDHVRSFVLDLAAAIRAKGGDDEYNPEAVAAVRVTYADDIASARTEGRRAGLEEAAKILEEEIEIKKDSNVTPRHALQDALNEIQELLHAAEKEPT